MVKRMARSVAVRVLIQDSWALRASLSDGKVDFSLRGSEMPTTLLIGDSRASQR